MLMRMRSLLRRPARWRACRVRHDADDATTPRPDDTTKSALAASANFSTARIILIAAHFLYRNGLLQLGNPTNLAAVMMAAVFEPSFLRAGME